METRRWKAGGVGGTEEGRHPVRAPQYLAVYTHPATVQRVLTQAGRAAELVLPCSGVDNLDGCVAHRPVDAEVGRLPWLPRLCVADAWNREDRRSDKKPLLPTGRGGARHSTRSELTKCIMLGQGKRQPRGGGLAPRVQLSLAQQRTGLGSQNRDINLYLCACL